MIVVGLHVHPTQQSDGVKEGFGEEELNGVNVTTARQNVCMSA